MPFPGDRALDSISALVGLASLIWLWLLLSYSDADGPLATEPSGVAFCPMAAFLVGGLVSSGGLGGQPIPAVRPISRTFRSSEAAICADSACRFLLL